MRRLAGSWGAAHARTFVKIVDHYIVVIPRIVRMGFLFLSEASSNLKVEDMFHSLASIENCLSEAATLDAVGISQLDVGSFIQCTIVQSPIE